VAVISFYSSTIFTDVGYSATQALYASLGYGAVQVVFTIPTLFMIDRVGRRRLCLIVCGHVTHQIAERLTIQTFPLMCIFLLAAGLSLLKTSGPKGGRIGPVVLYVDLLYMPPTILTTPALSTFSPSATLSARDRWLSNTLPRCLTISTESRECLGSCLSTTSLVRRTTPLRIRTDTTQPVFSVSLSPE
jgi:hypothetical protein